MALRFDPFPLLVNEALDLKGEKYGYYLNNF